MVMKSTAYPMLASLAPKARSTGSFVACRMTVSVRAMATRNAALVPRMRSAFLKLPRPSSMDALGAPPAPISDANAVTASRIGKQMPTPVIAASPTSGICPMNSRSMMVYEAFAACATMVGTDIVRASRATGFVPSPELSAVMPADAVRSIARRRHRCWAGRSRRRS